MPSHAHKKIIEEIIEIDNIPDCAAEREEWVTARSHLDFLERNAKAQEVVIDAVGPRTFVESLVLKETALVLSDVGGLVSWDLEIASQTARYECSNRRPDAWIERKDKGRQPEFLEEGIELVFLRSFDGWTGDDSSYIEISQEYAHVNNIHWRSEEEAYCRFDANGDIEHVVSLKLRRDRNSVSLASFKWFDLENYLAASNSVLVRFFDFTLVDTSSFTGWGDEPEELIHRSEEFFFKQKKTGASAYTRGVQIVRPRRSNADVKAYMGGDDAEEKHVEFVAFSMRHNKIMKISTDPGKTTNYFVAKSNNLPFEVSPAFFNPEVLSKYKNNPDKYTIDERQRSISCRASWSLRSYDVNDAGQISAYICDLRHLPYRAKLHWLAHNEESQDGISERAWKNDFLGEPASLRPRDKVLRIINHWHENGVLWWELRDKRLLMRANTPVADNEKEWSDSIMELSKLIAEGFKTNVIKKQLESLGRPCERDAGPIVLMDKFLSAKQGGDGEFLPGLREMQKIRSKVAGHAGGSEGEILTKNARQKHGSFRKHYEYLCAEIAKELPLIEGLFD